MSTAQFALFDVNSLCVDTQKSGIKEQIENIVDEICTLVSFKNETKDALYKKFAESMELSKNMSHITSVNLCDDKYSLFMITFVDLFNYASSEEEYKTFEPIYNQFCSQLTKYNVIGKSVITKMSLSYSVSDNNIAAKASPDTLSKIELVDVLYKLFVKNGLIVNQDGSCSSYNYMGDPFDQIILTEPDFEKHFRFHDYEFYTVILRMIVDIRNTPTNSAINEKATFASNHIVRGRVYVSFLKKPMFNEEPPCVSLSEDFFEKLVKIRKISSSLGTQFGVDPEKYVNLEFLMDAELEKYKDAPERTLNDVVQSSLNEIT